jgi:Lon protease-like protein
MPESSLPLFPLNTVLFPGGPLSLRIFEPRYLDMVRRCLKDAGTFGVALILEGTEAGAAARIADTGTSARLVDFDTLPDGLLGVMCVGERRFRVQRRWQQEDGLNLADIEYLPEEPRQPLPAELAHLAELLREVLPKLGGAYVHVEAHYEDAGWVGNRWAEILPLAPLERQELLELVDPVARLMKVAAWSARQSAATQV